MAKKNDGGSDWDIGVEVLRAYLAGQVICGFAANAAFLDVNAAKARERGVEPRTLLAETAVYQADAVVTELKTQEPR